MDLSHPGLAIAPTLDVTALEVLAGTTSPLPLSDIHRRAGTGSLSGYHSALARLVDSGLTLRVPGGYLLNRQHVAAEVALAIASLRGTLIERITTHIRSWQPAPVYVGIFGSLARREGNSSSDIDLLVIRERTTASDADQISDLAGAVRSWSGNELQVVDITLADLDRIDRVGEPILDSWRAEAIGLLGSDHVLLVDDGFAHERTDR